MKTIAILAPHADDETLGCGGTIKKLTSKGCKVHWIIGTQMKKEFGYREEDITARDAEIKKVAGFYNFDSVHQMGFQPAGIDRLFESDIIAKLTEVLKSIKPDTMFIPHDGDAHSDHRLLTIAACAAAKTFRLPELKKLLMYETPSETESSFIGPDFRPTNFCDISNFIEDKIKAFHFYKGEGAPHPFARSDEHIRALAAHRGATSAAAEAFVVLKDLW